MTVKSNTNGKKKKAKECHIYVLLAVIRVVFAVKRTLQLA